MTNKNAFSPSPEEEIPLESEDRASPVPQDAVFPPSPEDTFPKLQTFEDLFVPGYKIPKPGKRINLEKNRFERTFFGRRAKIQEIEEKLEEHKVVFLEGGHNSGKTSLLKEVAQDLASKGVCGEVFYVDFIREISRSGVNFSENALARINKDVAGYEEKDKRPAVIIFDEIEALNDKNLPIYIDTVAQLRQKGHYVLLPRVESIGNPKVYDIYPYKELFKKLVEENIVTNDHWSDADILLMINKGKKPIYSPKILDYLVRESGGHPVMCGILVDALEMRILHGQSTQYFRDHFIMTVQSWVDTFVTNVQDILEDGINPLTWESEYELTPEVLDVYKSMIPDERSTFFKRWLLLNKDRIFSQHRKYA